MIAIREAAIILFASALHCTARLNGSRPKRARPREQDQGPGHSLLLQDACLIFVRIDKGHVHGDPCFSSFVLWLLLPSLMLARRWRWSGGFVVDAKGKDCHRAWPMKVQTDEAQTRNGFQRPSPCPALAISFLLFFFNNVFSFGGQVSFLTRTMVPHRQSECDSA